VGLNGMCGIIQRVQQKNNKKDTILYVISGFCREAADNYNLLGYFSMSSGNFLEIKEMTTTCCVITQKTAVLKQYFSLKSQY
jgi:hypothetical protein